MEGVFCWQVDCGTDASSRLDQVSLPWTVAIIDPYTEVVTQSVALNRKQNAKESRDDDVNTNQIDI